ncbi:MAG: type II toxin-antitoxin system RelE/ParE family toxin [Fimbriiglobus sp.]
MRRPRTWPTICTSARRSTSASGRPTPARSSATRSTRRGWPDGCLIWTVGGSRDLFEVCEQIARDSSDDAAKAFADQVTALADGIPDQPLFGAEVPEYGRTDIREWAYKRYQLVYQVRSDGDVQMLLVRR